MYFFGVQRMILTTAQGGRRNGAIGLMTYNGRKGIRGKYCGAACRCLTHTVAADRAIGSDIATNAAGVA